jgi:hypothetical protein
MAEGEGGAKNKKFTAMKFSGLCQYSLLLNAGWRQRSVMVIEICKVMEI